MVRKAQPLSEQLCCMGFYVNGRYGYNVHGVFVFVHVSMNHEVPDSGGQNLIRIQVTDRVEVCDVHDHHRLQKVREILLLRFIVGKACEPLPHAFADLDTSQHSGKEKEHANEKIQDLSAAVPACLRWGGTLRHWQLGQQLDLLNVLIQSALQGFQQCRLRFF